MSNVLSTDVNRSLTVDESIILVKWFECAFVRPAGDDYWVEWLDLYRKHGIAFVKFMDIYSRQCFVDIVNGI
jgi:hypothetical protein